VSAASRCAPSRCGSTQQYCAEHDFRSSYLFARTSGRHNILYQPQDTFERRHNTPSLLAARSHPLLAFPLRPAVEPLERQQAGAAAFGKRSWVYGARCAGQPPERGCLPGPLPFLNLRFQLPAALETQPSSPRSHTGSVVQAVKRKA